jgi:hypothetical protein
MSQAIKAKAIKPTSKSERETAVPGRIDLTKAMR